MRVAQESKRQRPSEDAAERLWGNRAHLTLLPCRVRLLRAGERIQSPLRSGPEAETTLRKQELRPLLTTAMADDDSRSSNHVVSAFQCDVDEMHGNLAPVYIN